MTDTIEDLERKVREAAQAFAAKALEIENRSHLVHRNAEAMRLLRAYEAAVAALEAARKPKLLSAEEAREIAEGVPKQHWYDNNVMRNVLINAHERAYAVIAALPTLRVHENDCPAVAIAERKAACTCGGMRKMADIRRALGVA